MPRPKPSYVHGLPTSRRPYSKTKRFNRVKFVSYKDSTGSIKDFNPDSPARFKKSFRDLPAISKWFIRTEPDAKRTETPQLDMDYLKPFGAMSVPLEYTGTAADGTPTFERFEGSFLRLLKHIRGPIIGDARLYLAQHNLADLPEALREDVPTPEILKQLGKGDVYGSSLWMGRPPTRTPLHRDPNPNLFMQLCGKKLVRLFRPEVGKELYEKVRADVGADGTANMRGEEMMQGKELEVMEDAVWQDTRGGYTNVKGQEILLKSGDALYIPLGWWHAVHGVGEGPNVSVCIEECMLGKSANRSYR